MNDVHLGGENSRELPVPLSPHRFLQACYSRGCDTSFDRCFIKLIVILIKIIHTHSLKIK